MADYLYAVWFVDDRHPPADDDAEWVACMLIRAPSAEDAQSWGDHLAEGFCSRRAENSLLRSSVTSDLRDQGDVTGLPSIRFGEHASDDFIGW